MWRGKGEELSESRLELENGNTPLWNVARSLTTKLTSPSVRCFDLPPQDGVVKASMVIEGSESGKSSAARIKCMETLVGGSGYLVCSCTSEGVVSVWDMEGAANALMDDDEDDEDEDVDEDEDEEDEKPAGSDDDDSDVR